MAAGGCVVAGGVRRAAQQDFVMGHLMHKARDDFVDIEEFIEVFAPRILAEEKQEALLTREAELEAMKEARAAAERALQEVSNRSDEQAAMLATKVEELAATKSELEGGLSDM